MADAERGLALFLLGLIFGVLLMTGAFIYFAWRERKRLALPAETEELLDGITDEHDEEAQEVSPVPGQPRRPNSSETPRDPWERDPGWWQDQENG